MSENIQNGMENAESVEKQLDQLEAQNATTEENKKGSTNEIQPFATEEGLTQ